MTEREEIRIRELISDGLDEYKRMVETQPMKSTYYTSEDFLIQNIYKYGVDKFVEGQRKTDKM